jgi:DNA modification methylase
LDQKDGPTRATSGVRPGAAFDGANLRDVWWLPTQPNKLGHFAMMPPMLASLCIQLTSRPGDTVLDPFAGAGTTGLEADRLGRNAVLIELSEEYAAIARARINEYAPLFGGTA